jgi:hypothetical protein
VEFRVFFSEHSLQLSVTTVASDLEQAVVHGDVERVCAAVEQKRRDFNLVFAYRKIKRRVVVMAASYDRRIVIHELLHALEVACDAGAEEVPDLGAPAWGPK